MADDKGLEPVTPQPGKSLYLVARDRLREAIDAGLYAPGQQMPSTKELSEKLAVSLVTAHRALQELVNAGILERSQGKGTFVHRAYAEGKKSVSDLRIAVLLHREASLADFVHNQIVEGIRQGAQATDCDLIFPRYEDDVRKEWQGVIMVSPRAGDVQSVLAKRRTRLVIAGPPIDSPEHCAISVDNVQLARQAVGHLTGHGHTAVGFIGGADSAGVNRDRWLGYVQGLNDRSLTPHPDWVVRSESWHLSERERNDLMRLLSGSNRPTAIFAAGFYYALDIYSAAQTLGLSIGRDLSVIAIDDPPSAAYLSPPLTTVRQPLLRMGHGAITTLVEMIRRRGL